MDFMALYKCCYYYYSKLDSFRILCGTVGSLCWSCAAILQSYTCSAVAGMGTGRDGDRPRSESESERQRARNGASESEGEFFPKRARKITSES